MHQGHQPGPAAPYEAAAVPACEQQPRFTAMPASPADWRYRPPRAPSWRDWWHRHSRTLRALAVAGILALCGVTILALVREETGTQGLFVGLVLAVLPVPLLVAAFRWTDGVEPSPWRNLAFAFAWGACAATLIALLANTFATAWLADSALSDSPGHADTLGSTVVAPVVEETAKAASILLLFVFRRRDFTGVLSGIVIAGITATGFAFTENVLYLGSAYGQDTAFGGPYALHESATATTFFVRVVLSPFAHPLFTALTGVAFGIAAVLPHRRRATRVLLPLVGLLTAIVLHAVWNAAASGISLPFLGVYALFMLPVLGTLTWLAVWSRYNELRTIRRTLPSYAAAGWLSPPEAWGLASMRARAHARRLARRAHGPAGARTVAEYQHFATTLALLRARAEGGAVAPDFAAREQELLHHLWTRRALAAPPTQSTALALARPYLPPQWAGAPTPQGPPGYGAQHPYGGQAPYGAPQYGARPPYGSGPWGPYGR
ncbi:PrsW family intramembrane metalloprotease [Streptomyces sp. N2-109]|uniref:PrsW family intramembrane metalloprotease n=1 Tax=Streptomyces gossypii TaxID=2883101 RepID=A0ABT2JQK3_9ACTN|nr:PrsW family intramembrane metalloprotease [Streptomyces gossypii]MCT2589554.1 PrsW family intramembrane metalloprotease [Streptomyces gossypii]